MRVALISKACIVGIYQRKLEYISQQGVDLLVVVPPSWRDERGEMKLERTFTDGYRLEVLPLWLNGNFHLYHFRGLGRVLREFQPEIVHIDEEPYNLAAWQMMFYAKRLQAKTVFFSWQNILRAYPPPFRWGESWMLGNTDHVLVGTDEAGEVWRRKGYQGNISTVPQFGTDETLFSPTSNRVDRPFTIGFIGRLVREKGILTLIEAIEPLQGDWRLRIVGDGPLREEIRQQLAGKNLLKRTTFVGQIPSTAMPDQYHNIDALVLPSWTMPNWKEQFGRVLIEAMGSGIPVIGSDSGAIPEVIGDGGLIVPERDEVALSDALKRLMGDPALVQRLGEQGRKRVLEKFTHRQIAESTLEAYRTILEMRHDSNR